MLCAVCCVLCAVCCVLCAVCCVLPPECVGSVGDGCIRMHSNPCHWELHMTWD
jgi:hypothetical protein